MTRTDAMTAAILTETDANLPHLPGYKVATFANGTTGLFSNHGRLVALKEGRKLHVDGTAHWRKYGRNYRGAGLVWTGRRRWTGRVQCSAALWNMAGVPYADQRA